MNTLTRLAVTAALIGTSATASAWSDSPQPPYAVPQVPFSAPALTEAQQAAITTQQQAFAEQQTQRMQRAMEAQRQAAEQFAAHQQRMAQQWQERMTFDPLKSDPFASIEPPAPPAMETPFGPPLPEHVKKAMEASNAYAQKRIDESNARFEKTRKEMTAEREAMIKAMETRRQEPFSRPAPLAQRAPEKPAL